MLRIRHSTIAKLAVSCSLAILVSHQASAVGFIVNPTSENTGIANAGTAVYDRSVAAIHNNPAAMALMPYKQVGGNISAAFPDWSVDEDWNCGEENNCADSNIGKITLIPGLGLIRPMDRGFTWGIGVAAIAGQGVEYGDKWKGRAIVRDNSVSVLGLMNSIAWRMNEKWTFGVGVGLIYGDFYQKQDLPSLSASAGDDLESVVDFVGLAQDCRGRPPPLLAVCLRNAVGDSGLNPESAAETLGSIRSYLDGNRGTHVKLEGDDLSGEITLGATYEPFPGHRFGVVYRHTSNFDFKGDATINGQLLSDEEKQSPHMTLSWNMPDRFIVSGSHRATDNWRLFWDFERTYFNTFKRTDLRMDGYPVVRIDRNFKDANRYAVGTEYALNERWTLQFGASFDESPVDDEDRMPDIPVDEITKFMAGTIWQRSDKLHLHGYAAIEFFGDNKVEQLASIHGQKIGDSVSFESDATFYVLGLSFGYKF